MKKLSREEIRHGLELVNARLAEREVLGELCLFGGACLCLVFGARDSTKDIDAVFKPAAALRKAAFDVAISMGYPTTWLNDDVSGFVSIRNEQGIERVDALELSHLKVYAAKADYVLAMKCLAARLGGPEEDEAPTDLEDALWLCRHLGLSGREEISRVVLAYYPDREIPGRSLAFVKELAYRLSESESS